MAGIAADMSAGKSRNIAEKMHQQHPGFDHGLTQAAVHFDMD
jgi:hypothetical protein